MTVALIINIFWNGERKHFRSTWERSYLASRKRLEQCKTNHCGKTHKQNTRNERLYIVTNSELIINNYNIRTILGVVIQKGVFWLQLSRRRKKEKGVLSRGIEKDSCRCLYFGHLMNTYFLCFDRSWPIWCANSVTYIKCYSSLKMS